MKKARNALLLVFLSFLCVVSGFFIGRYTVREHVFISASDTGTANDLEAEQGNAGQNGKININTASVEQLQMLPDIGNVLATRIVAYRTQFGEFSSVDDLIFVDGIGEKRLEKLRQYITVGG